MLLSEASTRIRRDWRPATVCQRWPREERLFQENAETFGYLGGENLGQVRDRTLPRIEELLARQQGGALVVVGHNERTAWGFTTTGGDVEDLFIERLDPADSNRYLAPDGSAAFATREELINVRGAAPVAMTVRGTRHGPVLSDVLPEGTVESGVSVRAAAIGQARPAQGRDRRPRVQRGEAASAQRERRRSAGGIPPRGNNTARIQLCGFSKARPISCSDSPAFQRLQTSRFSIAESPNRIPRLMPTPPLQSRCTSDGVASTYRMHPPNRTSLTTPALSNLF